MILSKDSDNNWIPTAGGNGTFIGTTAAFNAIKDTLPVNTVAYITDDGNGDLQPVDAVTNGDMHPVTSNAVYDALHEITTGSGTVSLSGITAANADYVKYGRVVNVIIDQFANQSGSDIVPSGQTLITGFPKAAHTQAIECPGGLYFVISTNGNLYFSGATTWVNNVVTWFSFTYIASE